MVLVGELAVWSGLIAWSALSPGGPMPPPKADPAAIRLLSWNILYGVEGGPPWIRRGWPVRKWALRAALRAAGPDILCVQEALDGQVKFLEAELPRHRRVGVGRDDGRSAGEHCAIYFDAGRFEPLDGGTFWLEEPADEPPDDPTLGPKRICTWVRLRDRLGGRILRIYNTHLYLTERARLRAVRIILARVGSGDASDEVLIAGDFNAPPAPRAVGSSARPAWSRRPSWRGSPSACRPTSSTESACRASTTSTWAGAGGIVKYRVVDVKPGNTFPSDHFGDPRRPGGRAVSPRPRGPGRHSMSLLEHVVSVDSGPRAMTRHFMPPGRRAPIGAGRRSW